MPARKERVYTVTTTATDHDQIGASRYDARGCNRRRARVIDSGGIGNRLSRSDTQACKVPNDSLKRKSGQAPDMTEPNGGLKTAVSGDVLNHY